jgi:AcrR family transcriptional regulator
VATEEFALNGLSGARVDAIADRTRTSKRMIYYYFGSKEGLYRAVLEKAYGDIRALDSEQKSDAATPEESIRRIIDVTFDYDETHPNFISLVTVENIHRGRNIDQLPSIKERNAAVIRTLADLLERGAKAGKFRLGRQSRRSTSADQCALRLSRLESLHLRQNLQCCRPVRFEGA